MSPMQSPADLPPPYTSQYGSIPPPAKPEKARYIPDREAPRAMYAPTEPLYQQSYARSSAAESSQPIEGFGSLSIQDRPIQARRSPQANASLYPYERSPASQEYYAHQYYAQQSLAAERQYLPPASPGQQVTRRPSHPGSSDGSDSDADKPELDYAFAIPPSLPVSRRRPLRQPIAIPQLTASFSSPFIRSWAPESNDSDLRPTQFVDFIDELNIAMAASPPLQVLDLAGGMLGMVPHHWAMAAGNGISLVAKVGTRLLSKGQTDYFIRKSNKSYFNPRGLKVQVCSTEAAFQICQIPASETIHDDIDYLSMDAKSRRLALTKGHALDLTLEVPPPRKEVQGALAKLSAKQVEMSRKKEDKKALKESEKLREILQSDGYLGGSQAMSSTTTPPGSELMSSTTTSPSSGIEAPEFGYETKDDRKRREKEFKARQKAEEKGWDIRKEQLKLEEKAGRITKDERKSLEKTEEKQLKARWKSEEKALEQAKEAYEQGKEARKHGKDKEKELRKLEEKEGKKTRKLHWVVVTNLTEADYQREREEY